MLLIVIASTLLQLAAGFMALRLIADSGKSWAWTLLSAGIFVMAFRRLHTLYQIYQSGTVPTLPYELLGLGISLLIFAGIAQIGPLLRDMRQANQELAESEERYRTVAEFTHDWEYWMGPDGSFLYVSPACERITGHAPEAFINDPMLFQRIIHPADSEAILNKICSVEELRKSQRFDFRITDAEGATRWVAHNSLPVYSEGGVFLGIRASIRDIDHRKTLEQELRDSRALYQGLVENSRTMVLRLDRDGAATFANGYAIRHLDLDEQGMQGLRLPDVLASQSNPDAAATLKDIELLLSAGKRLEREIEFRKPDGTIAWSEWVGSAIHDEHGDISGFICVGIVVTRRKALDKLKEDVTRIIRHDLKSPLSGIIGIPRVLLRDDNITPHQKELLRTVEDAGTIMLDLINQSLNLYKLETGTYDFRFEDFDLLGLLGEIVQHIQIGHEKPVPVSIVMNGEPPKSDSELTIHAERALIFSMLANLVRNGLEASEGRPVIVDVSDNGNRSVSIRNAGIVPEDIRDTFFDKYVTSGKPGGTGLGTYSARLIARRHGGDVTMRSTPGEGTVITVTLPAAPPEGNGEKTPANPTA